MVVTTDGNRFTALDSLRGIAALGVGFHHIQGTAGLVTTAWHDALSLCVDFFFVLSGFVIAAAYGERLAGGFSTVRFMVLRLGRIYPLHLFMLAVYLLAELGRAMVSPETAFTGPRDPASLLAALLLVQAFVYPGADTWNVQSWSISVEVWLYLLAALALRLGGRAAYAFAALVAAAAFGAMLGLPEATLEPLWPVLRGLGGFGLGMALWPMFGALKSHLPTDAAGTVIEGALLAATAAVLQLQAVLLIADLVFAGTVLAFAGERGWFSRQLLRAPLVLLGAVSYSFYMIHGFVLGRAFDLLRLSDLGVVGEGLSGADVLMVDAAATNLLSFVLLALSVAVSWLTWRFIEDPARRWSRGIAARINRPLGTRRASH